MNTNPGFSIGTCYTCSQGRAFIARALRDHTLFIVCEECFTEWPDPESFRNLRNAGFDTHGRFENATREELVNHPWLEYVENTADLEE
jgi:hypothetical protein